MNIGLIIKDLMEKENIDASKLAKRLGRSKQAIYDMLQKEDINTSLLKKLAVIFDVPVTVFLEEDSSKSQTGINNVMIGRDNKGSILTSDCQGKLDDALLEIKHLRERLKDKDEMIEILKAQIGK